MPKKQPKIIADVTVYASRNSGEIGLAVEIDPANINLSDNPTVAEIEKAATELALEKLKVKLDGGQGRDLIKQIKDARKAAEPAAE
jgi:hypothetical protein